jgi:hypothetical protein
MVSISGRPLASPWVNAIRSPRGDQAAWVSLNCVSWRCALPSRRAIHSPAFPADRPEYAKYRPSGDHAMSETSTIGSGRTRLLRMSTRAAPGLPVTSLRTTSVRPSGDHDGGCRTTGACAVSRVSRLVFKSSV